MPKVDNLNSRTVLLADLPETAKDDIKLFERVVSAALEYYRRVHGEPKRVWVNQKDAPDSVEQVDGYKIERRGGCARGKIMVL